MLFPIFWLETFVFARSQWVYYCLLETLQADIGVQLFWMCPTARNMCKKNGTLISSAIASDSCAHALRSSVHRVSSRRHLSSSRSHRCSSRTQRASSLSQSDSTAKSLLLSKAFVLQIPRCCCCLLVLVMVFFFLFSFGILLLCCHHILLPSSLVVGSWR